MPKAPNWAGQIGNSMPIIWAYTFQRGHCIAVLPQAPRGVARRERSAGQHADKHADKHARKLVSMLASLLASMLAFWEGWRFRKLGIGLSGARLRAALCVVHRFVSTDPLLRPFHRTV